MTHIYEYRCVREKEIRKVFSTHMCEQAMIFIAIAWYLSLADAKRSKNRVKMIVFDVNNSIYLSDRKKVKIDNEKRVKKEWKEVVEMQIWCKLWQLRKLWESKRDLSFILISSHQNVLWKRWDALSFSAIFSCRVRIVYRCRECAENSLKSRRFVAQIDEDDVKIPSLFESHSDASNTLL